jgi:hypothetical protein
MFVVLWWRWLWPIFVLSITTKTKTNAIMKIFTNIEITLTPDQQQAIENAANWAEIEGNITVNKSSTDPGNKDLVSVYTQEGYKAFDFDLESNQAF